MSPREVAGMFARVLWTGVYCAAIGCAVGGALGYLFRVVAEWAR